MTAAVLERPLETTDEWNHSCTSQCSNPCTVNQAARPMVPTVQDDETAVPLS